GPGTWTSPAGCTCVLTKPASNQFVRSWPADSAFKTCGGCGCGNGVQVVTYTNGLLDTLEDRFGNTITFNYTSGVLTSMVDTRGATYGTYTFSYYGTGRLETVTAPDTAEWTFSYNPLGQ